MNLLPFNIQKVNHPHATVSEAPIAEIIGDTEVSVDLLLHSREIERFEYLHPNRRQQILLDVINEAREYAFDEFIHYLRIVAQASGFFPVENLRRYRSQKYSLLLSRQMAYRLRELFSEGADTNILTFYGYELLINSHQYLIDAEAYLVARDKYTIFVYPRVEDNVISVYRSDFIDLNRRTLPPIGLRTQSIIDLMTYPPEPVFTRRHIHLPSDTMPKTSSPPQTCQTFTECPECGGKVRCIGGSDYFCLDCNWDNMKPM